jgi:hypothetical protein
MRRREGEPEMARNFGWTVAGKGLCSGRPARQNLAFPDSFSLVHFFWRSKRNEHKWDLEFGISQLSLILIEACVCNFVTKQRKQHIAK